MIRGRPNIRRQIRENILNILSSSETPMTTSMLARDATKTLKRNVSWNTVQKYLQELIETGKVNPIQLPHSKEENKPGLVVYTLKK